MYTYILYSIQVQQLISSHDCLKDHNNYYNNLCVQIADKQKILCRIEP